jgi:LysM repeat protein
MQVRRLIVALLLCVLILCHIPATAQEDVTIHEVQRGETLFHIAQQYGTTVQAIISFNGLANADNIFAGQRLVISRSAALSSTNATSTANTSSYVVQSGDTLFRIAQRHGTDVQTLMVLNSITTPSLIHVGQQISVPSSDPSPEPEVAVAAAVTAAEAPADQWPLNLGFISAIDPSMREVYRRGQALGNDPHAFSKVGDCNSEAPFFLFHFDDGQYSLGDYAYLQPVIDNFAGSFARESLAVWTGNHTWSVIDSTWANPAYCNPGESPLACEYRLYRPSVAFVRLGTNDVGRPDLFEDSMREIIEFSLGSGVIPILGTKPDRVEGSDANNVMVRQLAAEYKVPLWNYSSVADTLPGRGLWRDGIHMNWMSLDFSRPAVLQTGHPAHNLTALMALDAVWRGAMVEETTSDHSR